MFLKSLLVSSALLMSVLMMGGCTTATPHESLKNAMTKTFDTTGYNYISTTRITKLSFPEDETNTTALTSLYLQKGIDVIRGFSFGINGAIDYRDTIRSEATYDMHYNRDNVEISMKFPFLFDYSTKTLYMGKTFLNTIFPMKGEDEGKLIRFDLNDTLISTLIGEESMKQFDEKKIHSINAAIKEGTIKAFSDINGSHFSYQPLSILEKNSGSTKTVHLSLDRNQSVTMLLTVLDSMIQKMYSESMITKEMYGSYMFISDPKQLEPLIEELNLHLDFNFGIDSDGHIVYVQSLINASDKTDRFTLGIENTTSLEHFNAPKFTLDPKSSGSVDYMKAFREWKKLLPADTTKDSFEDIEKIQDHSSEQII
ncbi:hypothetical protein [Sulfuricurvum sp. RIFCSPLOWO2_12_FULL_43_24]|uniref:hypothetical protein n=1 Tax=Sulfuricurvum sp. RIFCSPLOWO2_12_FULL_43_24 TaxID=1802247 RepID=UPI0008B36ED0|nr:hypothetical protein [Sulfuricurvum sp. RIFCSPLOWO2_12_FULL_43_24]OHD89116.1 MAG: hypothetical protein A3G19_03810 [Sulfuricurvum sp. RIFCSPLOWO2_12_FULL_43_24]